jgi:CheY-like chemotaxis protein
MPSNRPRDVVLVVEDQRKLADLYTDQLSDECDVLTAYTGEEALALLDGSIDVVLLDRKLPGTSGSQILDRIKARGLDCRVAMVTGVDPDLSLLDMQVDDYLVKPVTEEKLRRTVRMLANLESYRQPIREFHGLASKDAVLQDEMSQSELAASDAYKEKILQDVYDHELPPVLTDLLDEYQTLPYSRSVFIWKWVYKLAPENTLPFVEREFRDEVTIDKTLTILYITLLDDVLEKGGDEATFWELAKLPRRSATVSTDRPAVDSDYVAFGRRVWELLCDRIERGPNHDRYLDLFWYDVRQAINAIEYTNLIIQHPGIVTMSDLRRYESHNMVMFAYADIDLMHTARDLRRELATVRNAVWHAQQMARIGNWVSTWEREVREGDVSSGVVVYALEQGIITHSDLEAIGSDDDASVDDLVDRIQAHDLEEYFFQHWSDHYDELETINERVEAFDLSAFIEGTREVLRYHLASRGLK